MGRQWAEPYDTKSNVLLDGFWSQIQASYVSSHTDDCDTKQSVDDYIYIYIYIYIIIIMSRRLRGYPWPSLAISPYHSSPPAGLQDYNPCPHIAAVCKFVLVVPHLHIHEWGSTGVHRLWARPCFSSSVTAGEARIYIYIYITPKKWVRQHFDIIIFIEYINVCML